ncbi:MAG TPA: hypothetical protein VK009_14465 [Chloroflexota bacterium]|nr:hypothetical protein [Chloroflexota bacterium]
MDQLTSTEPATLHCARHSGVETLLRCGRCDTPICPRCSVMTPVGARCPDCAQVRRPPMYDLSGRYLWQALAAAVVLVIAGGFVFTYALGFLARSFFIGAILYAAAGFGIAEALSAVANRKRGPRLQWLAVITTVLTTQWIMVATLVLMHGVSLNPPSLVLTAIATAIAWARLR